MPDTMYCPHCGAQVASQDAFCGECGRRISPDATAVSRTRLPEPAQAATRRKTRSRVRLVVAAACTAALALAAGGLLLWPGHLLGGNGQGQARGIGAEVPPLVAHSKRLGEVPGDRQMSVQVLMPPAADLHSAETFLRNRHLQVTDLPTIGLVLANGASRDIDATFGIRLYEWQYPPTGETFYANDRPAILPFKTDGILGLDNAVRPQPLLSLQPCPGCGGLAAAQLRKAYNGDVPGLDGAGQRVAIFALSGVRMNDIHHFDQDNGLSDPQINAKSFGGVQVPFGGPLLAIPGPDIGPQGDNMGNLLGRDYETEADIDVEAVHSMAPAAIIDLYETDDISVFLVAAAMSHAHIASISYFFCESNLGMDPIRKDTLGINATSRAALTHRIVTQFSMSVFAASGDNGRYCPSNMGIPLQGVNYPASDPSVTAVGGTRLYLTGSDARNAELAWDRPDQKQKLDEIPLPEASGGGGSLFNRPSWQTGTGLPGGTRRMVPDVAADADLGSGLLIRDQGESVTAGGTSLAAPIWAGVAALYDQAAVANKEPVLGLANPLLYKLAGGSDKAMFDVTAGEWGGWDLAGPAGPGWDEATGLGTPNVSELIHDGIQLGLNSTSQGTAVKKFEPWIAVGQNGGSAPAPGLVVTNGGDATCDSGSNDDPGSALAVRCSPPGNGTPCFINDTGGGDPGSPLLCSSDPTSNQITEVRPAGTGIPIGALNHDDPSSPPWFLILADGRKCHFLGYGTNTNILSYDCGSNIGATVPDRSQPTWTVREGAFQANPTPSSTRIPVVTAYR